MKNDVKRQAKFVLGVAPLGQIPLSTDGDTSDACTVTVIGCKTWPIVSATECAFGAVHGLAGLGEGLPGQLYVAIPDEPVPGLMVTLICCGGGTKEAVTD